MPCDCIGIDDVDERYVMPDSFSIASFGSSPSCHKVSSRILHSGLRLCVLKRQNFIDCGAVELCAGVGEGASRLERGLGVFVANIDGGHARGDLFHVLIRPIAAAVFGLLLRRTHVVIREVVVAGHCRWFVKSHFPFEDG
ncbi:unnamed protein product [Zymoseptoria tritici ST99CH_3D1]|nr:unnamed protein product [Zymoseptoria tritici ST99CH_3D1]